MIEAMQPKIDKAELAIVQINSQEWDILQMKFAEQAARLQAIESRTLALELSQAKTERKVTALEHWQESARARLDCLNTKEQ
jgi:hypothetical protein